VLITGEGSHQLTAQEISQFGRRGRSHCSSNNSGYLIERALRDPNIEYNDLAQWHDADLPKALDATTGLPRV
jgi:indolepyruvate decarboxylase